MAEQKADGYSTKYRFTEKKFDESTNLYYFGARYYDPRISIWLDVDPRASDYTDLNPYNYTINNPIRFIDPTGMGPEVSEGDPKKEKVLPEVIVTANRIPKNSETKETQQITCTTCGDPKLLDAPTSSSAAALGIAITGTTAKIFKIDVFTPYATVLMPWKRAGYAAAFLTGAALTYLIKIMQFYIQRNILIGLLMKFLL